jgi:hypothetical protein
MSPVGTTTVVGVRSRTIGIRPITISIRTVSISIRTVAVAIAIRPPCTIGGPGERAGSKTKADAWSPTSPSTSSPAAVTETARVSGRGGGDKRYSTYADEYELFHLELLYYRPKPTH